MSDLLPGVFDHAAEHDQALGLARDDFLPLPQVYGDQIRPARGKAELTVAPCCFSVCLYSAR